MTDDNGSGTGLTLKQLVLEIRVDVRALRDEIKGKVDRAEFDLLKIRFDKAMSGEAESAYGKAMLEEYTKLKASVKLLESDREAVKTAKEIAEKSTADIKSNRRWIVGLVVAAIIQLASVVYGIKQGITP